MSSATLYRFCGASLLLGSLLLIIGELPSFLDDAGPASALAVASATVRLIGTMLIATGLPGLYARLAARAGIPGLLGFTLTFFFILMGTAGEAILAFIFPFLAAHGLVGGGRPPVGLLIFNAVSDLFALAGGILLGLAVLRAAILPRWAGALLIVGGILYALGSILRLGPTSDLGLVIFCAGLAWLAFALWSQQPAPAVAPPPPNAVRA